MTQLQSDIKANCTDARGLAAYTEQLTAVMNSKAASATSQKIAINMLGSVMSCMSGSGNRNGNGPNGTTPSL